VDNGQIHFHVKASNLNDFLYFLRHSSLFRFTSLNDLFGVDLLGRSVYNRYRLVYVLLSYVNNNRIYLNVSLPESGTVNSVTPLYPSANWLEREAWDMYGIFFHNHPDLRRILTDYGFRGHPLRKDFPLTGYTEVRYSEKQKRVLLKPVQLTQEYRYFEFLTPWEKYFTK
jgi:NADH-quinone oxidoreductase subunit C